MKMNHFKILLVSILAFALAIGGASLAVGKKPPRLMALCGSALKPPMDEIIREFSKKYGVEVNISYGGSGEMLSQAKLSGRGDVFISGSPDFMEMAKREGAVKKETEKRLAYMIPAIVVQKGNPKKITRLEDLSRPDVSYAIAEPKSVCLGVYAVELLEKNRLLEKTLKNVKTRVESCSKTASVVAMKKVDAVIGWQVFDRWSPELEVVPIPPERLARIAYAPAAVLKSSKSPDMANKFVKFLDSKKGREIFRKHGYITSKEEAAKAAPGAVFGGEYRLPDISGLNGNMK